MELAVKDLYRAKWTDEIHDEWIRNLKQNKPAALKRLRILISLVYGVVLSCQFLG